ncbi:hypothetical protein [Actinomyces culturomici]|nr:hypothetical protein [Actinomyces culturomici]
MIAEAFSAMGVASPLEGVAAPPSSIGFSRRIHAPRPPSHSAM